MTLRLVRSALWPQPHEKILRREHDCSCVQPQDRRFSLQERTRRRSELFSLCREPSTRTYTRHGGHVQFVSLVAVAGVALGHSDAPAVLTAVQDAAVVCAQAGRLVAPCR